MHTRDIYSVYHIPKTIYFAASVHCRRCRRNFFQNFFAAAAATAAVIVVDVNSEYIRFHFYAWTLCSCQLIIEYVKINIKANHFNFFFSHSYPSLFTHLNGNLILVTRT